MLSELSNPLSSKIFCTQQAIRLQNYLSQQQVGSFVGTEELSLLLNIDQYSLNGVLEELVVVDYLTHSEIHECSEAECRGNELTQSGDHFECDLCDRKFRFEPKSKRSGFRLLKSIPRSERQVTSMFNVFLTDVVVLKKADGRVFPNIKASVQDTILITDVSLPVEAGDEILRELPNGLVEVFKVTDPGFRSGFATMPATFEVRYKKSNFEKRERDPSPITVNMNGNARLNLGSLDSSVNHYGIDAAHVGELFKQMKELAESSSVRKELLPLVAQLQTAKDKGGFASAYNNMLSFVGKHADVAAKLLPLVLEVQKHVHF